MSKKQNKYTAGFKEKVVLDALSGDFIISDLASKYSMASRNILNCEKEFLANSSVFFDKNSLVYGYIDKVSEQSKEIDELHRQLGKHTA